ncbi:hypothetical protein BC939DRAFT_327526 [Gamsiella multidivaricata]|uniref:uncharacterized protein n=1 Tax=Gamsiella multidivaricata TaxID=101098 RepID=UPI00221FBE4F|nr:uncharacterized protein BC939DRAFT_327526 [Gamsiella multidivaricata]KAI7817535.1 hypothetical protein BC939DRAFT_327526 [Gamsiella multidivaricata]
MQLVETTKMASMLSSAWLDSRTDHRGQNRDYFLERTHSSGPWLNIQLRRGGGHTFGALDNDERTVLSSPALPGNSLESCVLGLLSLFFSFRASSRTGSSSSASSPMGTVARQSTRSLASRCPSMPGISLLIAFLNSPMGYLHWKRIRCQLAADETEEGECGGHGGNEDGEM